MAAAWACRPLVDKSIGDNEHGSMRVFNVGVQIAICNVSSQSISAGVRQRASTGLLLCVGATFSSE